MKTDLLSRYQWHVRRIQAIDSGRSVGESKLRGLKRENHCTCGLWIPKRMETTIRNGVVSRRERALFPGYVLLGMPDDRWPCGLCALPVRPLAVNLERKPLGESVVRLIVDQESYDPGMGADISKGSKVQVIDGPFSGFVGEFIALSTSTPPRAVVKISLFEREVNATLPLAAIEVEHASRPNRSDRSPSPPSVP